jgi:predicted alpha/beta hydrolase
MINHSKMQDDAVRHRPAQSSDSPGTETPKECTVSAADGYRLAASVFHAAASDTVLLVNSATAVPRQYYQSFADYVRCYGWTVVTYDYRGIGGSKPASLRGFEAQMRDWALLDMTALVDWTSARFNPRRLFALGHSFGGQSLGMLENAGLVSAMVGVSAQSGYWRVQGGAEPLKVWFAVTVLFPILTRMYGYFPWARFARGEDLPKGVALEWARWCRDPDYLLGDASLPLQRYKAFTAPVLAYSIEDDDWGTQRAVDDMMRAYTNVSRRHIVPEDYGFDHLGHMGFFRPGREVLWRELIDWFEHAD